MLFWKPPPPPPQKKNLLPQNVRNILFFQLETATMLKKPNKTMIILQQQNSMTFMAVTMWQKKGLYSKKLNGHKKNSHTCVVRGQKWPPLEMNGKHAKIQILFCVYNQQISHDEEKMCTAMKGWHSKISRVQNRHLTHPHRHKYMKLVWL